MKVRQLKLIQEEVGRINKISEYNSAVGNVKSLNYDLSNIVISHTKNMLTESVSEDTDFDMQNLYVTMDGNNIIIDGHVIDANTQESRGYLYENNFQLYLELAEKQRDLLFREGINVGANILNETIKEISEGLREHGDVLMEITKRGRDVMTLNESQLNEYWGEDAVNWTKDKVKKGVKWVKDKGLAILSKGFLWFGQKLESILFTPAAIAADVALTITGIGSVAIGILWGIVAIYRIYVWSKDMTWWNFFMVVISLIGAIPAGAVVAGGLRLILKPLKGLKSTKAVTTFLKKTLNPKQIGWIGKISSGSSKAIEQVSKSVGWLGKKMPAAKKVTSGIRTFLGKIITKIKNLYKGLQRGLQANKVAVGVASIAAIGHSTFSVLEKSLNYDNIGETELVICSSYGSDYGCVGDPIGKVSMEFEDFTMPEVTEGSGIYEFVATKGSPQYDEMLKNPYFNGLELKLMEGGNSELNKCSSMGCPPGFKMTNGEISQSVVEPEGVTSDEEWDKEYERIMSKEENKI